MSIIILGKDFDQKIMWLTKVDKITQVANL
jgi:hypothetical protein